MDLTTCKLYGVQRKRDLSNILKINCKEINKIVNSYKPYIANKSKKRLIEPVSSVELKKVQKRIQNLLKEIKYDSNVFSGISGRSYIDNGRLHLGCEYVVALDISKFFPNTSREKVYKFFKHDMKNSSDIAEILTNLCTIDLSNIADIDEEVIKYISENRIRYKKHIPTGSSISCILSYLVNYKMFDEIVKLGVEYRCKTSIYVDDVVISSTEKINKQLIDRIMGIIKSRGYSIQKTKLKFYDKNEFKRVTGNIISKDGTKLVIPNKIRYKMIKLKKNKEIQKDKKEAKLNGYNQVINQINMEAF
ncbi:MAG: RNA-directed DNA polymerase [Clostridia bacterium]|nr:RNA-directed DNA polymerase [Clostridia bacterium]